MKVRTTSTIRNRLRALVAVPLACLILFWGLAVYLTLPAGAKLSQTPALLDNMAQPMAMLGMGLQDERRAAMVYLARPSSANRATMAKTRKVVDARYKAASAALTSGDVTSAASDTLLQKGRDGLAQIDDLPTVRTQIDQRGLDASALMDRYDQFIDGLDPVFADIANVPDDTVAAEGSSLLLLNNSRELLSREDAIMASVLATGHFTTTTYRLYAQAVGVQRYESDETYEAFSPQDRRRYDEATDSGPFPQMASMEDNALQHGRPDAPVPISASQWNSITPKALLALSEVEYQISEAIKDHIQSPTYLIFVRVAVVTVLGLLAFLLSAIIGRRVMIRLVRHLRGVRDTARDLAWVRLPSVVERLRAGQPVDVGAEVPTLRSGLDEIGQVAEAFNEVGRTAVQAATEQAALRAGVSHVFLNIARRTQTLVHGQLAQLDVMERKALDPEVLEDLFKVDHLATRMRRNAENLVILGGGVPGRIWREPVPLLDVLRSAASEVESYERVRVLPFPSVMMAGSIVSDVIHLCAELIDNATRFSPPHTRVHVTGQSVPKGFAIEIEDRGLGMEDEQLLESNTLLTEPPEFDTLALTGDDRLGMFVVARLAARNDIKVHLRRSPYGGTTAIVLLPAELVAESGQTDELSRRDATRLDSGTGRRAALTAGTAQPAVAPEPEPEPDIEPEPVPALAAARTEATDRPTAELRAGREPFIDHTPTMELRLDADQLTGPVALPPRGGGSSGNRSGGWPRLTALPEPAAPTAPPPPAHRPAPYPSAGPVDPIDALPAPALPEPDIAPDAEPEIALVAEPPAAESHVMPPVPAPTPPVSSGTHLGLPKRVRQASLAPGLRAAPTAEPAAEEPRPAAPQRTPEEIRAMMSSYQRGTLRGRTAIDDTDTETDTGNTRSEDWPTLPASNRASGAEPRYPEPDNQTTTQLTAIEVGREDD